MALILFDYDGVLADTLHDLIEFAQTACDQLGVDHVVVKEDLRNLDVMSFHTYGRACEVPESLLHDFVEICVNLFADRDSPPDIFPGLKQVVADLSIRHKIAIVTTNTSANVKAFLSTHGLGNEIQAVYGVDQPGSKAQKISMARGQFFADRQEESVFMVGDSLSDMLAAKEAGAISVGVAWGHQSVEKIMQGHPDYLVHSPQEIMGIFDGHAQS